MLDTALSRHRGIPEKVKYLKIFKWMNELQKLNVEVTPIQKPRVNLVAKFYPIKKIFKHALCYLTLKNLSIVGI